MATTEENTLRTVQTDGMVYLVEGEDENIYGTYLVLAKALERRNLLKDKYGDCFIIKIYRLGDAG